MKYTALDLLMFNGSLRINGEPVVSGPRGVLVDDETFVEWYTGSDEPGSLDYRRVLVRSDVMIEFSRRARR